ncbi:hypothetical protein GS479_21255 [Rhodococcus hoagii]|nr:hypothetical protein [Prescottella equi]
MTLLERREEWFELSEGWSAAFWVTVASAACGVLFAAGWWAWILLIVAGALLTYGWWRARRRGRFRYFSAVTCALSAGLALFSAGAVALANQVVRVDSVGQRELVCGSVLRPVPDDRLAVTVVASDAGRPQPVPQSELVRICRGELSYATKSATGAALVGVLLSVRAVGHVVPRRPVSAV